MAQSAESLDFDDSVSSYYGADFVPLFGWAKEHNKLDTLVLIYHAFEQSERFIDPHRIIAELQLPYASEILSNWTDNDVASDLNEYCVELSANPDIIDDVGIMERHSTVEAAKGAVKDITQSGYLLALSYSHLFTGTEPHHNRLQVMLRLWCYVHGIYRLRKEGRHDKILSQVARYLIVNSKYYEKIQLFEFFFNHLNNNLANEKPTFERCNYHIGEVAKHLATQYKKQLKPGQRHFLNRIARVAKYDYELFPASDVNHGRVIKLRALNGKNTPTHSKTVSFTTNSGAAYTESYAVEDLGFTNESLDSNLEDNGFLTVEVSSKQTVAEQIVTSRGVFIQRAEQTHLLPWSWDKILPPEIPILNSWLRQTLNESNPKNALAAAIIWLAKQYGRSLKMVLTFGVNDSPSEEWTLDPSFNVIRRKAIRRHSTYRPDESAEEWLAPLEEAFEISLPTYISEPLRLASTSLEGEIRQLSQLWGGHCDVSLVKWFNQNKPLSLERISSLMFSTHIGQEYFNLTEDSTFSRAWSSHSANAIPAAIGYGSWNVEEILNGKAPSTLVKQRAKTSLVGSTILAHDSKLKRYIDELTEAAKQSKTLIEFHNRIAHYTVQALHAALGTRNLVDPFESLSYFHFASENEEFPSCVFINDKQDDIHHGRLVPLCNSVEKILNGYLEHLLTLSDRLKTFAPDLANRLSLISSNVSVQLPLFFLLDDDLQWHSMSNTKLISDLPYWPLPANTFRHRFSQQLNELGLPNDILEAWMGHDERGVSCYGDYSPRCWLNDVNNFTDLLETSFDKLGFQNINLATSKLPIGSQQDVVVTTIDTRDFGEKIRTARRKQTINSIKEKTNIQIEELLNGRDWAELGLDEFQTIVNSLTKPEGDAIAIAYPLERLEVLYQQLEASAPHLIRHIKKRHLRLKQETPHLNIQVIQAVQLFPKIKSWASESLKDLYPRSVSLKQATQIGVTLLCIEQQISYLSMLQDITDGQNYSLVQYGKECFLRYSEEMASEDLTTAAQHHRISYKTASFLDLSNKAKNNISIRESIAHTCLNDLAQILNLDSSCSFDDLLSSLCNVIMQANLVRLPGIVAAGLSDRQPPSSLSLQDYVRARTGKALSLPAEGSIETGNELKVLVPINAKWIQIGDVTLEKEADNFHKEINVLIGQYEKSRARSVAKDILKTCKQHSGKVSSAVLCVGYWIAHVISVGKYQGRRKLFTPLAQKTISTYYATLMVAFKELAYKVDIFTLSEEEFYELYGQMLDYKREKDKETGYFGRRLLSFHSLFISQGLPEIDWGELDFKGKRRVVSSGFITEKDYQSTLKRLAQKYEDKNQAALLQFVLLLSYRFGLRLQEATHILRKDWNESDGVVWLSIRKNKYRGLKSDNGTRAIPLLFEFSDIEQTVIKSIFNRYELNAGNNDNHPLLSEIKDGGLYINPLCYKASSEIIAALREQTGNNRLVLHHARHAFHNHLAAIALGIDTPLTKKITDHIDSEKVLKTVMGPVTTLNRRSPMALSVLMGHAHPSTSLRSYNHLVTEWADYLTPLQENKTHKLKTAVQLNDWNKWTPPKIKKLPKVNFLEPTLRILAELIRLVALGKSFMQAASILDIELAHAENIQQLLVDSFPISPNELESEQANQVPYSIREYLSHISETAWLRVLSHCDNEFPLNFIGRLTTEELPLLVGSKRQILMCTDTHYELVRELIAYFDIPEECYEVSVYQNSQIAKDKLRQHSLNTPMSNDKKQIDIMNWFMADGTVGPHRNYAAFWLKDRVTCSLRSSYETALITMLIGYLCSINAQSN